MKRIIIFAAVICLLVAMLPLNVFAVDPMSSAMMMNAMAQAWASYAASQGVAMTFDVSSTDSIGDSMSGLFDVFRSDTGFSDTFEDLAITYVKPALYVKMASYYAGQVADIVGVQIDENLKPILDDFFNWLLPENDVNLTGNQYHFNVNQIPSASNPNPDPIQVYSFVTSGFPHQPISYSQTVTSSSFKVSTGNQYGWTWVVCSNDSDYPIYLFAVGTNIYEAAPYSPLKFTTGQYNYNTGNVSTINSRIENGTRDTPSGVYWKSTFSDNGTILNIPAFNSVPEGCAALADFYANPSDYQDSIGIRAYDTTGVAEFPDTTDPNYEATHPPVPLNTPWDPVRYGDGTGNLSDAQVGNIASDLTRDLEIDRTVELADSANPPGPTFPNTPVYVPFLPIQLPSFNFSLSGIWHYVREWVGSLSSWMTSMFNMWSCLPYAMVVPVYATAVVIIVLGMYRRFFM